jgi:plasmid segregation protein ParM
MNKGKTARKEVFVSVQCVGLDIGYGFVKVTDGEYGYAFPSVVGNGHTKTIYRTSLQVERINDLRVVIDNQLYFVGKAALRHSRFAIRDLSDMRTQNEDLKVLFLSALSFFCQDKQNRFKVVTGMPPGRMYLADDLINRFAREYTVSIYGNRAYQETTIRVDDLEVVPQPVGTYWAQTLDLQGREKRTFEGRVGIIDIGFRTTDLAAIEDGEFIPSNSYTIPVGISATYTDIGEQIISNYGLDRESFALDESVIKGMITVSGRPIDITAIRNEAFQQLANKLLIEVTSKWRVLDFDRLLLSGGGGQALSTYLLSHLPQAELVPNPSTANSRGYLSWANRLWGDFNSEGVQ